jgi:hypothetical protein
MCMSSTYSLSHNANERAQSACSTSSPGRQAASSPSAWPWYNLRASLNPSAKLPIPTRARPARRQGQAVLVRPACCTPRRHAPRHRPHQLE